MAFRGRTDGVDTGGSTFRYLQKQRYTLVRLGCYMMRYRGLLALALAMTAASNVFALMGPLLSGYAVDAIEPGPGQVDLGRVFYYAGWMAIFYVVSALLSYGLSALMIVVGRKVAYEMRRDLFERMLSLPVGYFDRHETGDILSRISYDIDTINGSLSHDLIQMLTTVITVAGALLMMVMISPWLVLVFLFTVPLSAGITRFITNKTRPLFRKRSASLGRLNGFVEETITGRKAIKAYCGENNVISDFEEKNRDAVKGYYKAEYYGSTVGPMVNFINNLSLSLISVFGAFLYLSGKMGVGQISSFVLYSRKFSGPINEMANMASDLQSAVAAAERVFALMDELPEESGGEGAQEAGRAGAGDGGPMQGEVQMQGVNFGYEPGQVILHDFSLHVGSGQLIAIVGPTGAGKTTLINLLMRFYDPQSGEILVDGKKAREIQRKSLRSSYAMVLQDTWLFHGTIYENLAYGMAGVSGYRKGDGFFQGIGQDLVVEAAKAAHIHTFIMQQPNGYGTVLREGGANISQGQKQLLTIARAMLQESPMLILDEATSNVDTRTEIQIQQAVRRLTDGKTCFVIAHRLSTIRNADRILVVNHGGVVEQGTHDELIAEKGLYYEMYQAQGS